MGYKVAVNIAVSLHRENEIASRYIHPIRGLTLTGD